MAVKLKKGYWHLLGGGQDAAKQPIIHRTNSHDKKKKKVSYLTGRRAKVKKACYACLTKIKLQNHSNEKSKLKDKTRL